MNIKHFLFFMLVGLMSMASVNYAQIVPESIVEIAWSPNGTYLAYAYANGSIVLTNSPNQTTTSWQASTDQITRLEWNSESRLLGVGTLKGDVIIWDIASQSVIATTQVKGQPTYGLTWHPIQPSLIAIGGEGGDIVLWDIKVNNKTIISTNSANDMSWNTLGNLLGVLTGTWIDIYQLTSLENVLRLNANSQLFIDTAWKPNTNILAASNLDNHVYIWNIDANQLMFKLEGNTNAPDLFKFIADIAWSPDGQKIAVVCADGLVKVWNANTGQLISSYITEDRLYALDWSPDGAQINYGGTDQTGGVATLHTAIVVGQQIQTATPSPATPSPSLTSTPIPPTATPSPTAIACTHNVLASSMSGLISAIVSANSASTILY